MRYKEDGIKQPKTGSYIGGVRIIKHKKGYWVFYIQVGRCLCEVYVSTRSKVFLDFIDPFIYDGNKEYGMDIILPDGNIVDPFKIILQDVEFSVKKKLFGKYRSVLTSIKIIESQCEDI